MEDTIMKKTYAYIKSLNMKEHEVQEALDQLEKSDKIKVTRIPGKTEITFSD